MLQRLQLRLDLVCASPAGGPCLLWGILAVQVFARALEAWSKLREACRPCVPGDGALCGLDRFALAAIEGHECPRDEIPRLAQHRQRATDLPQGLQGVLPNVRHRRVSRAQLLEQPHSRTVSGGLLVQATTRAAAGESAVHGERDQRSRGRGRPPRGGGWGALEAAHREVEVGDAGSEETAGMRCSHGVVEPLGDQERFVAVGAVEKTHARTPRQKSKKCLVTVSSAIVYQNIAFSHSLALQPTAASLRFAPASGSR